MEQILIVDESLVASLGERTILFSLGPLHVEEHRDGYNHFYEFYEFPARPTNTSQIVNKIYTTIKTEE